jgi:hypothetical protein
VEALLGKETSAASLQLQLRSPLSVGPGPGSYAIYGRVNLPGRPSVNSLLQSIQGLDSLIPARHLHAIIIALAQRTVAVPGGISVFSAALVS